VELNIKLLLDFLRDKNIIYISTFKEFNIIKRENQIVVYSKKSILLLELEDSLGIGTVLLFMDNIQEICLSDNLNYEYLLTPFYVKLFKLLDNLVDDAQYYNRTKNGELNFEFKLSLFFREVPVDLL